MTFPSAVKKSGPITLSKTGSGSKTLSPGSPRSPGLPMSPGLPKSPGSPLNISIKPMPSSVVKTSVTSKSLEKSNVESPIITSVKKPSSTPKNHLLKSVSKPVEVKTDIKTPVSSISKRESKLVTKPPPLKLNIKAADVKGLQSPESPKSVPKTPSTPFIKSLPLTKSVSSAKSPMSPTVIKSQSSFINKSSRASAINSLLDTKSFQETAEVESSSIMSSPVTKSSKLTVSKTSTTSSPELIMKDNAKPTSIQLEDKSIKKNIVKSSTPIKTKAVVSTNKTEAGIKLASTSTNKSSIITRSPTGSSIKSISLKVPLSPSKPIIKESKTMHVTPTKSTVINKSSVISKSGSISPKVMIKKESSSALSLTSVKSSSTTRSTSSVSKATTLKTKVNSTVFKDAVPKSPPVSKTQSSAIAKTLLSPKVESSTLSSMKTPLPLAMKTKTPSSPTVKSRTLSLSSSKLPPLSPTVKKMVPNKLILSPGLVTNKSSRLNSVSIENLTSKTLKSPMSPKSRKMFVESSPKLKINTDESKPKGIRGRQLIKTIDIPGITELNCNSFINEQETQSVECRVENLVENILKEEIESTISQIPCQDLLHSEELITLKTVVNIDDSPKIINNIEDKTKRLFNSENIDQSSDVQECSIRKIIENNSLESLSVLTPLEKHEEEISSSLDFVVVKKDECVPCLNSISQSSNNCDIVFDDNHFKTSEDVIEQLNETQSCSIDMDDNFEPMNDKLVLGDVPFETDSSLSDVSDSENPIQKEVVKIETRDIAKNNCVGNVFSFPEDLSNNDFDRTDSTENFIHQFMPKSIERPEGSSSISTDDGSFLSRKSYSEAVSGSIKDEEYYFDYDFEVVDDCLDDDDEERSVFVEVTEKEFPELKPKDLSSRKRNKKQKKRQLSSNKIESYSDLDSYCDINYNSKDFNGNEFCHYIKMMKDCSFYPNGLFSSDSVKLSTSSSLSWLDISVRTTDDDLIPSTETLSTYEVFQASNLNKDFLTSIIGTPTTIPTNETTWFWKSIEGKHQSHNKANITLSLKPRPKHLTTPRFMTLLALISEAKGYEIQPSLSEHFVTTDCVSRFDEKIRRLMVQGFWLVGRLIKESLSEDEEVNCGNPFKFIDGDIGFWWAGIHMLDWQEYMKECNKNQILLNCYQFVIENMNSNRHNFSEAVSSMNALPDDFMSELDVENFIHTVRNVKYYCGNFFVDSQENLEASSENCVDDDNIIEW